MATSCHNCVDGLNDLIRHYKLDMKVVQLVNLVANALVVEKPVECSRRSGRCRAAARELEGYKILVVDDEPDVCDFLSTVLEDNGAERSDGDHG